MSLKRQRLGVEEAREIRRRKFQIFAGQGGFRGLSRIGAIEMSLRPRKDASRKDRWDRQIEKDLKDGKLEDLIEKGREDYREGRTKPLP